MGYGQNSVNLQNSSKPLVIYGDSLSSRYDGFSLFNLGQVFAKAKQNSQWLGIFRFPLGSNSVGKSFLGISSSHAKFYREKARLFSYVIGLENKITLKKEKATILLETSHTNSYFRKCKFILPIQTVLEKTGHFINSFGTAQKNTQVLRFGIGPFKVLEDFVQSLKKKPAPKLTNAETYSFSKLVFDSKVSKAISCYNYFNYVFKVGAYPFKTCVGDIYKTDNSTKASPTLAKVSANLQSVMWHFL